VAEEAGTVVETAIGKREWALEVLDKSVEAEEAFAARLHYECYLMAALAVPEVAVRGTGEEVQRAVREIAEEAAGEMAATRKELSALRRDAAALTLSTNAARAAGRLRFRASRTTWGLVFRVQGLGFRVSFRSRRDDKSPRVLLTSAATPRVWVTST
jgi:uncharacterized protein YfiM (DUF2279 family)